MAPAWRSRSTWLGCRPSVLRLANRSSGDAEVSVDGTDDLGLRPGTTVRVVVPATGKWRLRVESDRIGAVLSLLSSPSGHLTNLSHADGSRGLGPLPAAHLPAPETVTLESPGTRQVRGRWSAVEGASYDVDLLRDGAREEDRSLTRARNTTTSFRWSALLAGTDASRVCSVNEDRLRGPCRESNEVVIDRASRRRARTRFRGCRSSGKPPACGGSGRRRERPRPGVPAVPGAATGSRWKSTEPCATLAERDSFGAETPDASPARLNRPRDDGWKRRSR